mmetsp:Transcript_17358/g.49564  ORF Transcript_17358/g.49564 Transcript_17358/m.49564 type:complete len:119 (+) Transcript_17358:513-869(+)
MPQEPNGTTPSDLNPNTKRFRHNIKALKRCSLHCWTSTCMLNKAMARKRRHRHGHGFDRATSFNAQTDVVVEWSIWYNLDTNHKRLPMGGTDGNCNSLTRLGRHHIPMIDVIILPHSC